MRYKFFYYLCSKCEKEFDILKSVQEKNRQESCTNCGNPVWQEDLVEKVMHTPKAKNYAIIGAKVKDAEYNYGLGCVTKSDAHRKEVAHSRGLEEIGNDYVSGEAHQESYDSARIEKLEKSWDEI